MPAKIRILSEEVINQIAAGEIIESPASAIKELVENAVDAGAKRISVTVIGGGHGMVQVEDDGCGMGRDDAVACLERHATSKLRSFDDLARLTSMGFRGEALASIAAVSQLEITTRDEEGTRVVCHGGSLIKVEGCARNRGTTVTVSSLFYNVPARKNFQKGAAQELAEIGRLMTRMVLAHPDVAFFLNEKRCLPPELGEGKEIYLTQDGYTIQGWVGTPSNVSSTRTKQYMLVNKRSVTSKLLEKAVVSAFGTRINRHEHPVFILSMEVPPDRIDVNVHPQKSVVRFAEEEKVHRFVKQAVERIFVPLPTISYTVPEVASSIIIKEEAEVKYQPEDRCLEEAIVLARVEEVAFVEYEGVVWVLDLPKVDAKVQFHRLLAMLQGGPAEQQQLLFPEVVHREEVARIDLLQRIGIAIRPFGKGTYAIDAMSPLFSLDQVEAILEALAQEEKKEVTLEHVAKLLLRFRATKHYDVRSLFMQLRTLPDYEYAPNGKRTITPFRKEALFG